MTSQMIQPNEAGKKAWLDMICAKSGKDEETVKAVLEKNAITARQTKAVPQRLTVTSIAFSGVRGGTESPEAFTFKWSNLGPGLWAVLSDANLRGKTTILNVIRWALTGKRSARDDIDPWFRTLELVFLLDGRSFKVDLTDAVRGSGRLLRRNDGKELTLAEFWDDQSFEGAMSDFFMTELGLQPIVNHTERDGKSIETPHGWNWLFSSMLIEPAPVATFGSQAIAGMPTRMMQMFIGLPWANTTNDIKAAQGRLATKASQADTLSAGIKARTERRIVELTKQKEEITSKPIVDTSDLRKRLGKASDRFSAADARLRALLQNVKSVENDEKASKLAHDEARRSLLALKESVAAGYVFRTLKPVCCPSCDEAFTHEREQQHQQDHVCVVCGTPETEAEDSSDALERAEAAVKEAAAEVSRQQKRTSTSNDQVNKAETDRSDAERECEALEKQLSDVPRDVDPRVALMLIDAQLKELESLATAATDDSTEEKSILEAAEHVTKSIYQAEQARILQRVSDLTADYARKFGVESIDSVQIQGGGQMRLVKRGVQTSFRHQTDGEKARLKVAATLAMLKVSEDEGVGRHTGLLLIDSPKSNEMVDRDYAMLIEGLTGLTEELQSVQAIFTGIAQSVVLDLVPERQRLHAKGDNYLW